MKLPSSQRYAEWLLLGKGKPGNSTSPFYSRIYAGYSKAQLQCVVQHLAEEGGSSVPVFDPMAGQAFALSTLSWFGHQVRINDINPAPLLLAWLRSAEVLLNLDERIAEFTEWLHANKRKIDRLHSQKANNIPFITGWLSESMTAQLQQYGTLASEDANGLNLLEISHWGEHVCFRFAILLLAARRITCFIQSDNRTWLKPGGLDNKPRLTDAILHELDVLQQCRLADDCRERVGLLGGSLAPIEISCADIARTDLPKFDRPCIGVTSPPYANRLDYSVLWGPELWTIAAALPNVDPFTVSRDQIGTTKIRHHDSSESLELLPAGTRRELREIERSTDYASKSYYHPFFRQFALDLFHGLHHSLQTAPKSKKWIIFIRDTARKDIMFSSHAICEAVMKSSGFKRRKADDLQIIRSHIGVMRRAQAQSSVHGLAQREWWLVFERER